MVNTFETLGHTPLGECPFHFNPCIDKLSVNNKTGYGNMNPVQIKM